MTEYRYQNGICSPEDETKNKTWKSNGQANSDGNTAFLRAARSGNLEKVLEFINANVDINTSNANGLNALHLASKDGHAEVVVELLKRGANVDAATKKGNTALHIASLAGQEEVVKLLVEHGASVNVQSQSGFTPLYMAAQENHERVVRFLLNHGANQNLATEDGFTPLAVAMQQGNDKVVTELLENDTRGKIRLPALHIAAKKDDCKAAALLLQSEHNPDITSKSGFTPLHIASHYGNDAIASLLLAKGADVNYAAKHNITPLHVAAKWGRNNMVILLLDKGACITAKTRDGLTPLHCAARSGHEQVVDTLLQRHAPITAKTKNGLAPLHMASQGDHVEAARVLLSHRAPVDDVTVDYLTALHVASHCGHVSVAKLLLDRKADPNARALNGFTPLHIACKKNRVKIVELLLKHGASIEATTESGLSPLHVASFMGCMNIVIYLLQCEANPDVSTIRGETPLHLASRANQTDIIRILLRNGAQVDAKAREQQTPLHIASRLGNTDIVMLLLQHGASVDAVTKDLYTPLHIAAKEDQEEVAQTLLENNATLTATTKKGFTPLHLAAKYGRTKIATLLLQRGAPVDAQGKNGVTPLHVASHYDHQGIALQLLDKGASPHATAKNGHTPLHIAAKKNQMDIAAMLLEYGANADIESKAGFTPLHLAAQGGHADMTNLLLEHKADVNHSSKNGLTPLHLCAQEDCVEVAKILVKNGADVNAVTKAAYTPLHIASHFGQLNMVRFLLSQKAKVDTITSTGYTPLHQAAQQGNSAIVAVLLDNGASPETKNNQGQTALYIAQKLGYISVVEVLKNVTEGGKVSASTVSGSEEKYKVVAPETMQENFMSDSEDEGGDDAINETSYRYLTIDEMKSLGDDSLPLDITKEDRYDTTAGVDESISPQHTYNQLSAAPVPDNVDVTRAPVIQTGFLVSFLVDAKGGAMRGCRHSGVRVIVPPQSVTMPTRVTCRYVRRDKPNHPPPPPLMEGEALSSRILELGPVGVKFLGPVVIEVPNFAALRGNEREIVILRSDNGETWREHTVDSSQEVVQEILSRSFDKDGNQIQLDEPGRITAIVTSDFPHYFAIVSRIRQEVHAIGPEGGMVSSSVVPQVQAVFPQGALTKKIKVGLQAQPIPSELTAAILGNCVAVSPIVTIEPRRRKFHKPITLTLPVPQAANKGMINQYSGDAPTLRLLCSITGGTSRAQWEDVTGSTPLTFVKECVSFTTTVSARFWLMDIRDIAMATKKATELYREAIHIPFMAKFVVFAKRIDNNEARLRVFCMTDDKEDKTLECQEHFTEVAKSRDVEVLEGKKQLIELSGNLISVTKSGEQLKLGFSAFHENRLPFTVRIKDSLADPIGRMLFFKEQKPVKTSTPHPPICVLNIVLPDGIVPDPECLGSPMLKYNFFNDTQDYHRSEVRFSDISNLIGEDWIPLSEKLCISSGDVNVIKSEYPESVAKQALTMLRIWHQQAGSKASPNILENALLSIGRQDIVQECILNTTEQQKKHKHAEKEAYSKEIISEVIEDYHVGKKNTYTTDDDEKKYTAEEKAIDEHESKKSVSERKMEIERRLLGEPTSKSSTEHYENEEKRQLPDRETEVVKRQKPEQLDIVKSVVYDDKEEIEPTSLTFQQKRLSFERGLSVDKILSEQIVDSVSIKEEKLLEKPKTEKKEDRIMHINKEKIKKDDKSLFTDPENSKFEKLILEKTPTGESETFINEEKTLSFAEKRLSFEQADGTKIPPTQSEIKVTEKTEVPKRSVEDTRRDSELFESVSVGLRKLDTHPSPAVDQCYLSPNPVKTPPPSPAEFKVHDLQKKDSVESSKSGKSISDEDPDLKSENTSELTTASLGNVQQHSYTTSDTSLVQSQANFDNIAKDKSEKCDNMNYVSKKKFWQSFESTGSECKPTPVPKPRASICTTGIRDDTPPVASKRSFENICPLVSKDVIKSESVDNIVAAYSRSLSKPTIKQMHSLTAYSTDSEAEYIASCGIEKLAYENIAFSEEEEDRSLDISSVDGGVKAKKMFFEQMQKESITNLEDSVVSPPILSSTKIETKINKFEEHFDKSEMEATEKKEIHIENVVDQRTAIPIDVTTTMNICSIEKGVDSTRLESYIIPVDLRHKEYSQPSFESISVGSHKRTSSDRVIEGLLNQDSAEVHKTRDSLLEDSEMIQTSINNVRVAGNESAMTTFLMGVTNTEIANEKVDIKVEDNVRSTEDVHKESRNENGHENELFTNASVLSEENFESYYMENVSEENTKSKMFSELITSVAKEPLSDFTDEVHIRFSYEEGRFSNKVPDIKTAEHSENETKNKIKEVSMQPRNNSSNEAELTKLSLETKSIHEEKFTNTKVKIMKIQDSKIETLPVEKESEQEQNIIMKIPVPKSPFGSFGNEGTITENILVTETSHVRLEQNPFVTQIESVNNEIEKSHGKPVAESKIPISKCSATDKIASLKRETSTKELKSNQTGSPIIKNPDHEKNIQEATSTKMVETVTIESSKNVEEKCSMWSPSKNNNELASVDGIILQSESHSHFNKCEDKSPSVLTTGTKMEYYSDVEDLKTTDFEILTSDETNIPDSFCIKKPEVTCILQSEITSTLSEKTSSDDSHAHTKGYDVSKLKLCENESCKEFRTEDEMESVITKVKKSKIPVLSSHIETISQPFTICFHEKEGASLNKTLDKCKTQASFEKSVKDSSSVVTETIDDRLKSSAVAESEAVDSKPVITETVFNKFVFLEDTETLTNTMVEHMISCKSEPPVTKTVVTETVDSETAADIKIIDTKSNDSVFSIVSGQSATNTSPIISEKMSMKLESVIASEKSLVTDTVSTESSKSKSSIIFEKPVSITCAMLTETVSSRDNTQATSQSELLFMSNMKITDIDCSESELSTVSEKLFPTNTIVMETISTQSKPQNVSNFDDSMKKKIKFDKYESSTIPEEPSSVINTFVESNLIPHVSQTVSEKFAVVNNVEDMKSNACIKENISNISTAEITKAIVGKSESLDGKPAVIDTTVTKSNFDADKLQNIFEKPIEITSKQVKQTTSNVHEYQIFPENIIVASTVEAEITSHKSEPTVEKSADIFTAETVFHHEPELSATREESAREMVLTENISSKSECSAIPCESLLPRKLTSSIPSVCETQHDNSVVIVERTSAEEKYKKANCKFHFESPSSDASSRATSTRIFLDNEIIDEIYKEQTEFILLDESSHETGVSDEQIVTYDSDNKRILISEDEAKIVAENLVMEIETEINKRPDIIENLLLLRHADLLRAASGDPSDDISNDITDEDLRSTGTEVDLPVAENHEFYQKNEICDRLGKNVLFAETAINIGEASPTEYEISYEQAEEFNILESVDFTDQLVPLEVDRDMKSVNKPSKPQLSGIHTQSETERKNSDEFGARNDILSPESGTSDSARRCEDIISCSRGRKSTADMEPCSSSSESHYLSFTSDNRTTGSRPCSSDIEGLLSSVLPGTTGSSEYDTAVSQDTTSFYSHDFYTAVSSASLHESLKSMESESSGHQGSAEVSSEISETLVPSSAELEHDIDIPAHGIVFENNRRLLCHKLPLEPYDQDIPVNVIRAASSSIITSQTKTTTCAPISIKDFSDDKMISSNEDTSSISTTDGATLPTMFEVASNESDRLDNSLISEQSLTMSSASYQFDAKENVDVDHKVVDTNTFITSVPNVHKKLPSITMITSTIHDEGRQHVCTQMTSKVENLLSSTNESPAAISPESESFELVEKPDLLDDFVVIEEVAKEACEEDEEGKGIRIIMKRKSKLYDEEQSPPPKTNSTLTQVKYYSTGGTPEDGYNFEGVTFEQEKQSPDKELYENSPPNDNLYEHEVEEGKKWIERQFQTDSEVASEYEYTFERIPLEDIKEEDTDDMQSSKVGSVSSQISQSVGSFGSMKQSLSSTPDYDILAGKRYFSKPTEPDTISQASLQEFERLEQLIALESMKGKLSGSQDSIASSSNGSDKKRSGDDISVSSLKVFEGLEYACVEAEKIEERAKAEERSLSQIEEGHESQASESESCETLEKSQYESEEDENDYDRKMFEIDEIIRQAQSNVEQFVNVDHLEKTESLGRGDSFEETSRIPDFELDRPLTDINCGKKYIENVDASRSLTTSTDSLELKHAVHFEDTLFTSTDSLEAKVRHDVASDSLDSDRQEDECRANTISDRSCISEKGGDFLADDVEQPCRFSPNQISSPDSGEATSSATTHATYQNEADSIMSSSFTSGGSNTMISSTENLENIISGYSNWLDGSQSYVTEVVETVSEDKNYITTHHTVEIAGDGVKTVGYQGPDARTLMERDIADFKPGEYCSETQDIDADGTVHIRRIVEMRTVVSSEQVESSQKFTFGGRSSSSDDGIRDVQVVSHTQSSKTQPGGDRTGSTVADVLTEKKSEIADETATDQKKPH